MPLLQSPEIGYYVLYLLGGQNTLPLEILRDSVKPLRAVEGRHDRIRVDEPHVDHAEPKLTFVVSATDADKRRTNVAVKLLIRNRHGVAIEAIALCAVDYNLFAVRGISGFIRK